MQAKKGLALINGTQTSTALALEFLLRCEVVFASALISGSLSLDAARGSDAHFDARIHAVRGQPGRIEAAAAAISTPNRWRWRPVRASSFCDR